jgi:L-iduronidase
VIKSKRDWEVIPEPKMMITQLDIVYDHLQENYPEYAGLPLINNESDIKAGWFLEGEWRATSYYAAMVAKLIDHNYQHFVLPNKVDYPVMSFDHGFLGNWYQRTLLATYGNNWEAFTHIPKPAYNIMVMLSLLGDEWLDTGVVPDLDSHHGIIATKRGNEQIAILQYHTTNDPDQKADPVTTEISLKNIPFQDASVIEYRIDGEFSNPYNKLYRHIHTDSLRALAALQSTSEPQEVTISNGSFTYSSTLENGAVSLLLLTAETEPEVHSIDKVTTELYENHTGSKDLFITWSEVEDRSLYRYEVIIDTGDQEIVLNEEPIRISAFSKSLSPEAPEGNVVIKAYDFWGRLIGTSDR